MTLSRDHLTMIEENTIFFFSFNFSLKKIFPSAQIWIFFNQKKRKKIHPAEGFFELVRVNQCWQRPRRKQVRAPKDMQDTFLPVVASFTYSLFAVSSVANCTLLNMTYLWSVSPKDNGRAKIWGRKYRKNERKVQWEMGFFLGFLLLLSAAPWADGRS